jgi:hypothetical protein
VSAALGGLLPQLVSSDTPSIHPWRLARRVPRRDGRRRHLWEETTRTAELPANCSHVIRSIGSMREPAESPCEPTHTPYERHTCNGRRTECRRPRPRARAIGDRALEWSATGERLWSVTSIADVVHSSDAFESRWRCRGPSRGRVSTTRANATTVTSWLGRSEARKAKALRPRASLHGWIHGVSRSNALHPSGTAFTLALARVETPATTRPGRHRARR